MTLTCDLAIFLLVTIAFTQNVSCEMNSTLGDLAHILNGVFSNDAQVQKELDLKEKIHPNGKITFQPVAASAFENKLVLLVEETFTQTVVLQVFVADEVEDGSVKLTAYTVEDIMLNGRAPYPDDILVNLSVEKFTRTESCDCIFQFKERGLFVGSCDLCSAFIPADTYTYQYTSSCSKSELNILDKDGHARYASPFELVLAGFKFPVPDFLEGLDHVCEH